jgi:hypothetical protein
VHEVTHIRLDVHTVEAPEGVEVHVDELLVQVGRLVIDEPRDLIEIVARQPAEELSREVTLVELPLLEGFLVETWSTTSLRMSPPDPGTIRDGTRTIWGLSPFWSSLKRACSYCWEVTLPMTSNTCAMVGFLSLIVSRSDQASQHRFPIPKCRARLT